MILMTLMLIAMTASGAVKSSLSLPKKSQRQWGYSTVDSVRQRMAAAPLLPLEGIWEMTVDGAVVAIEREPSPMRTATATYRIVIVRSPDRSIPCGTLLGVGVDTSKPGQVECLIYTKSSRGTLYSPAAFVLELGANGRLGLYQYRRGVRVNAWGLLPYMWRRTLGWRDERPKGIDGMVRLFPFDPSNYPIIYL